MKKIALMGTGALLVGALFGGTTPAKADVIGIFENDTGLLEHTLTNTRPTNYLFGNITGLMFAFTGGVFDDFDDKVTNVTIADNLCSGASVAPGNSCTFSFRIVTADPTPPEPDLGTWAITAQIQAQWFDITINDFRTDTFNFNDTVNVFDPIPLPGALPLFATGLVGLALLGWRRKRKLSVAD